MLALCAALATTSFTSQPPASRTETCGYSYESAAVECNDGNPLNGFWTSHGGWAPGLPDLASWFIETPAYVRGNAVWYSPGVMEATARVRGLSLEGYAGGVSALSCANVGRDFWIRFPGEGWRGPFLVVDCAQQNDVYGTIIHRDEVAEISWRLAVELADGPPPWRFENVEVSKVPPKELGDAEPIELKEWYLDQVSFTDRLNKRPLYRPPENPGEPVSWRIDGEWVTFDLPEIATRREPLAPRPAVMYPEPEPDEVPVDGNEPLEPKVEEENTMGLEELFNEFWAAYGGQVTTIIALIVADVLLGVLAAVKAKSFEWERVGDFYRSKIIPFVGGYVVLSLLFGFGDREILGQVGLGDEVLAAAEWIIYLTLAGSILGNLQAIGIPQAVENALTKAGARPTPKERGAPNT